MKTNDLPKLIYACPETDADLLFATRFFAPDPFLFLESKGRRTIVLSDLEVDRGRQEAKVDEVLSFSEQRAKLELPKDTTMPQFILAFLKSRRIRRALVPENFPLGLAEKLQKEGTRLVPREGMFYAERAFKGEAELKLMRKALQITEAGMARGIEVLKASAIASNGALRWGGKTLTSERLRAEIDSAILHAGGLPANTIVAGGEQACDPHERGSGPLKARSLIILDIFPRAAKTGYYGDLTRTVVRGKATEAQRTLWEIVRQGQARALKQIKAGIEGKTVEDGVKAFFAERGYPMEQHQGRWRGMFHGLGHGLGLEVHEHLRVSRTKLQPGHVVTVEPGLYWPGIGGVRHEDVVAVTETGSRMLSRFPKPFEI